MDNGSKNLDFFVERNFLHKSKFSKGSIEHIAYVRLVSGDSTVENREDKKAWLQELSIECNDAMREIMRIKSTGRDSTGAELSPSAQKHQIEQIELKVLHLLGWRYSDSFLYDAHKPMRNADGSTYPKLVLYPELYFTISTREFPYGKHHSDYRYIVSYGIMRNVSDNNFGSYSYFDTMDEALEFINDQLLTTGRKVLRNKYISEAFSAKIREDNITSPLSKKRRREYDEKAQEAANRRINRELSEEFIKEKLHKVRSSTDIRVLPDFIDRALNKAADKLLANATEAEFRTRKARSISDADAVKLDDELVGIGAGYSKIDQEPPLDTDSLVKQVEEDAQKRSGNMSTFAPVPPVPVSDSEDLFHKPPHNVNGEENVQQHGAVTEDFAKIINLDENHPETSLSSPPPHAPHDSDNGAVSDSPALETKQATDTPEGTENAAMGNVESISALPLTTVEVSDNSQDSLHTIEKMSVATKADFPESFLEVAHAHVVLTDNREDSFQDVLHGTVTTTHNIPDSFVTFITSHGSVAVSENNEDSFVVGEALGFSPDEIVVTPEEKFLESLHDDMEALWLDPKRYPTRQEPEAISGDELVEFL